MNHHPLLSSVLCSYHKQFRHSLYMQSTCTILSCVIIISVFWSTHMHWACLCNSFQCCWNSSHKKRQTRQEVLELCATTTLWLKERVQGIVTMKVCGVGLALVPEFYCSIPATRDDLWGLVGKPLTANAHRVVCLEPGVDASCLPVPDCQLSISITRYHKAERRGYSEKLAEGGEGEMISEHLLHYSSNTDSCYTFFCFTH